MTYFKRTIGMILCIAMIFASALYAGAAGSGDVNGDGKVNSTDARAILRHSAKIDLITDETALLNADVNGDEKINSSDARLALRIAAHMTDEETTEPEETTVEPMRDGEGFVEYRQRVGCRWCGRTDCPSLFDVYDEWGQPDVDYNKCPKYDIHKDPLYYCQECGYPTWRGAQPGEVYCNTFLNSTNCPDCGEWVEWNECHYHTK